MKPLRPLPAALIAFGSAFLCGGLAALLTRGSMDVYSTLRQPPLAPPAILFPIAWSALYALMGVSLYRVLRRGGPSAETAALVYALQLVFNFAWSLLFFNARLFLFVASVPACADRSHDRRLPPRGPAGGVSADPLRRLGRLRRVSQLRDLASQPVIPPCNRPRGKV